MKNEATKPKATNSNFELTPNISHKQFAFSRRPTKSDPQLKLIATVTFSFNNPATSAKMVAEMSFSTVNYVIESWEKVRRIPNYEAIAGVALFRKFFEAEPAAVGVFSFGKGSSLDLGDEFFKSPRLLHHATYFIKMIDRAIALLGPDIELLTDIMLDLGKQHHSFGVKASFYPALGQALMCTLEDLLGHKFRPTHKEAWLEVYQALSYDMIRGK